MAPLQTLPPVFALPRDREAVAPGRSLLRLGEVASEVLHIESGRVTLGLLQGQWMAYPLGEVEGPYWLEVGAAVLALPSVLDAVADTPVWLRRMPLSTFRAGLKTLPKAVQTLLHDQALAHRQQTELAISLLANDAQARCAQWLLRHAQPSQQAGEQAVLLHQSKRLVAAQLGIAPETLSRVLRHLRQASLISGSGRVLNLLNPQGLRALAGRYHVPPPGSQGKQ